MDTSYSFYPFNVMITGNLTNDVTHIGGRAKMHLYSFALKNKMCCMSPDPNSKGVPFAWPIASKQRSDAGACEVSH